MVQHLTMVMAWQYLASDEAVIPDGEEYPENGYFGNVAVWRRVAATIICVCTGTWLPSRRIARFIFPCLTN